MYILVLVLLAGLSVVLGARATYAADLSTYVLGKIAARANAGDSVVPPDDAGIAALTLAGRPPRTYAPTERTVAPDRSPEGEGTLQLGQMDGRIGLRNLKTWYAADSVLLKAEFGYDGALRLQADRPWLGGNLRFGLTGDQGHGELRLEFKRNF